VRRIAVAALLVLSACTAGGGGQGTPTTTTEPDEVATTVIAPGDTIAPAPNLGDLGSSVTVPGDVPTVSAPVDGRRVTSCGVERQAVKTATDADASKITAAPMDTTIADLDSFQAPANPTTRTAPVEETTYRVHATLTLYKVEADSDYHLVLSDHGHTMIAEIAAPACVGANGALRGQMSAARAAFDAHFRPAPGTHRVNVAVTVIGVGFFDRLHGQSGVAPNGVELHPVESIVFEP